MNAIKYLLCILLLFINSKICSQIPDTIWTKTFGGSLADVGNSVMQTNDGGFIIAGTTSSFGAGGQDIWLIKTNENGDTIWTKTFGGTGNDRASNVVQTIDNGYAVFGTTNSFGNGGDDFLLWKTDSLGNTKWYKTYGSTTNEAANEGHQLIDGSYILAGDSLSQNSKAWLIKTNEAGDFIWGRTVGSTATGYNYHARSVQQTNDAGFAMSGLRTRPIFPGSSVLEYCFYKISSTGNLIFYRTYGSFLGVWSVIIRKLSDGNFILGGSVRDIYGGDPEKPWILKIDQYGNIIWDKVIPISQNPAILTSIEPTNDNGFAFTVYAAMGQNISLFKCDENGILNWEKIIGGSGVDDAYCIQPTDDSGYIVTGRTNSFGAGNFDIWLLNFKYNPSPEIQISKDSLNLTFDDISFTSRDSLIIYNTGNATLNIDTIYSTNASGFILDIILKDTTIHSAVTWRNSYYNPFEIEPGDSAKLIFTYPLWIPKNNNITATWRDTIIILNNSVNNSSLVIPALIDFPVGIGNEINNLPLEFSLSQNYPNPFNPATKIKYEIPDQVRNDSRLVTLKVYDVLGNEIATLVNEEKQPGTYEVEFDGTELPSGIYFYQLKAGNYIETKKMVLMK